MASFVDALRPKKFSGARYKRWFVRATDKKFSGARYKRWSVRATDWLTAMKVFWVKDGLPEGNISDEDKRKFQEASDIFLGAMCNVLSYHLYDYVMHF